MRQRTTWSAGVLVCLLAVGGAVVARGEEAKKEGTGMAVRPMELYTCKYRAGKGLADLQQVAKRFNAWMDATHQDNYWAFLLSPYFRSADQDFDVLWAGGWRSGADMAGEIKRWVEEGGAVGAEFDKVVSCVTTTNFAILDLSAEPAPPDSGPVTFTNCTIKEGRKFPDALAAVNAWLAWEKEHGVTSDNYILFPAFGEKSDAKYSFKWVTTSSWDDFGRSYDQYGTGGGWMKARDLFDGLLDCDSGRVYVSQRVRHLPPAK